MSSDGAEARLAVELMAERLVERRITLTEQGIKKLVQVIELALGEAIEHKGGHGHKDDRPL